MAKRRCKFGVVKRGRRKGQCLKARRKKATARGRKRRCRFGVVKTGRRKGQCLKRRRRR